MATDVEIARSVRPQPIARDRRPPRPRGRRMAALRCDVAKVDPALAHAGGARASRLVLVLGHHPHRRRRRQDHDQRSASPMGFAKLGQSGLPGAARAVARPVSSA